MVNNTAAMPVGTEVTLMTEGKRKFFIDTNNGEEITLYKD